ncbi:hypothetical protein JI435_007620, partial [Parastagonospora nodorum SN15]
SKRQPPYHFSIRLFSHRLSSLLLQPSRGYSYSQLPALGSFAFQFLAIHPCGVVSSFSALGPSLFTAVPIAR